MPKPRSRSEGCALLRHGSRPLEVKITISVTWDKKEIDIVEEAGGKLHGYEIKWNKKSAKAPKLWLETYPNSDYEMINKNNYLKFVS